MKRILTMLIAAILLSSCGGLSSKEKQIVGLYYNPAVSDREPVFEFYSDGSCVMRAIRPDVLTLSVKGTWHVVDDTLVIHHNLATVTAVGDTSIVGTVAPVFRAKLIDHTDYTMILDRDGIEYEFLKRNVVGGE